MIRNANIDKMAQIDWTKIAGAGLGPMTGEVLYVSKEGTNARQWLRERVSAHKLFLTLDEAVGACAAERGDTIIVAPGHTEVVASAGAIDLDVANVSVIGVGRGSDMPMLDFTNASGSVVIGAENVLVRNLKFHANVPDVTVGLDVEATGDYCQVEGCRLDVETAGTDEFLASIRVASGVVGGVIHGNYIDMGLGNASGGIQLDGATDSMTLTANTILGDYSTACIQGATAASTKVRIGGNLLVNGDGSNLGTEPCIDLNGNSTGLIYDNYCVCNLVTVAASIVAAQCLLFENYYNEDVSGAGTGGIIGTASAND